MRTLIILLLSLLLAAGCAVETPYYGYGPYYDYPYYYYGGPVYGYYGPYFYHDFGHHDFDGGHHEFGENHGSGEGEMHAHR